MPVHKVTDADISDAAFAPLLETSRTSLIGEDGQRASALMDKKILYVASQVPAFEQTGHAVCKPGFACEIRGVSLFHCQEYKKRVVEKFWF
jgi:hypothetical protein